MKKYKKQWIGYIKELSRIAFNLGSEDAKRVYVLQEELIELVNKAEKRREK